MMYIYNVALLFVHRRKNNFTSCKISEIVFSILLFENVMLVFHWSRPCIRPYNSRVGCESRRIVGKKAQKCCVGLDVHDRMVHLQTGSDDYPDKT